MNRAAGREARFRALYEDAYDDVLRFALRRCVDDAHAEDVVAEAMLAAWRRIDDLPRRPDDARAWLFGVTRNCLLNVGRGNTRRTALAVRIAQTRPTVTGPDDADAVAARIDLGAAWSRLTPDEQDVLALTVFEGLTSPQAGTVLVISGPAYRLRLSRARRALRRHLEGAANDVDATVKEMHHERH